MADSHTNNIGSDIIHQFVLICTNVLIKGLEVVLQ